jgi:hypothetical protein
VCSYEFLPIESRLFDFNNCDTGGNDDFDIDLGFHHTKFR